MKTCKKCGMLKALNNFTPNRHMRDGRLNVCKDCNASSVRALRKSRKKIVSEESIFEKRFAPDPNSGCWLWLNKANSPHNGYGRFGYKRTRRLAHVASWEIHNGKIPLGLKVLHKCDNPACVNPSHLFLGTQMDNIIDMMKKGRHCSQKVTA